MNEKTPPPLPPRRSGTTITTSSNENQINRHKRSNTTSCTTPSVMFRSSQSSSRNINSPVILNELSKFQKQQKDQENFQKSSIIISKSPVNCSKSPNSYFSLNNNNHLNQFNQFNQINQLNHNIQNIQNYNNNQFNQNIQNNQFNQTKQIKSSPQTPQSSSSPLIQTKSIEDQINQFNRLSQINNQNYQNNQSKISPILPKKHTKKTHKYSRSEISPIKSSNECLQHVQNNQMIQNKQMNVIKQINQKNSNNIRNESEIVLNHKRSQSNQFNQMNQPNKINKTQLSSYSLINEHSIIEKEYYIINSKVKPSLISKDMINVEDTIEIRHFLCHSETELYKIKDEMKNFNYIEAERNSGELPQPMPITINIIFNKYKASFTCFSDIKTCIMKEMIQKVVQTKVSSRFPLDFSKYIITISGTRLYFDEEKQLREYSFINDLSRREKILNVELIEKEKIEEKVNQYQLKHQQLLSTQRIKCIPSKYLHDRFTFSIVDFINCPLELVFKKFYDESEIPSQIALYNQTGTFEKSKITLKISCNFYMGTEKLSDREYETPEFQSLVFRSTIITEFTYAMLPLETRLGITLYATRRGKQVVIGFVNIPLFDFQRFLLYGLLTFKMWPDEESDAISSPLQNPSSHAISIGILFPEKEPRVFYEKYTPKYPTLPTTMEKIDDEVFDLALHNDLFKPLTKSQKLDIWKNRYNILTQLPDSLDLLLRSVPWIDPKAREEMEDLISIWPGIKWSQLIGLLDVRNSFTPAREYAVKKLDKSSDKIVLLYLPQFVQLLKFESYMYSPFVLFLLKRCLLNRGDIGQLFYWLLIGENEKTSISLRSKVLLEVYNSFCGTQLPELKMQENFIKLLENTAIAAKWWNDEEMKLELPKMLTVINNVFAKQQLTLPFTSRETVSSVLIDKCKIFDSNAHPILMCFQSSLVHTDLQTRFIFKVGDNLMQDMLTLQMFKLMDDLWKTNGMDFRLTLYNVLATSKTSGIIQFVPQCETVNSIQTKNNGVTGVFDDACIYDWLKEHNPDEKQFEEAIENFTYSCAGYCVATYVIGVGDRHNDNIMVCTDGHLFHIDFGYFLGNIIKLGFYNKESAPFVLTNDFMYVITKSKFDVENYAFFESLCVKAFKILRANAKIFIYSFMMMLCSGIPQLRHVEDVEYLKNAFMLDKSDEEAEKQFRSLIIQSLNTFRTRMNFFMHSIVH